MKMTARLATLSALLICAAAYKEFMLKENKTPKDILITRAVPFNGTCDECKMLVKRFAEAIKNPQKLAELKDLLRMLCHETTYEDECRVFVDQLDHFIAKLEPYLDNPEKVCQHFRLCGNRKIEYFHRIDMNYGKKNMDGNFAARDLVCEECQFAAQELKHAIEDEKSQERVKRFISEEVCSRLGSLQGKCDLMLEEFMPELIEELDKLLQNTKTFCADLGLCKRFSEPLAAAEDEDDGTEQEEQNATLRLENFLAKLVKKLTTGVIPKLKSNMLPKCEACRDALNELKARLVDPSFQADLEKDLCHGLCRRLPYETNLVSLSRIYDSRHSYHIS